ncbi:chemotaxis protein CheW [Stieleria sp. ICT_E10.1]|uniref:chemotaxis protein CheW n=1 Tax=Stieleria sedimenti TaxID=2976331 RepID=UPI00217FE366|nr:chemotaxis protein CheW [Stieleria sedimenti]MCS7466023.1 chemotaxis protein CheW [Stieleria sedimenti]
MNTTTLARPESYCTFLVDGLLYGIEVQNVQEVVRVQPTTRVPLAPQVVRGLMNLRGHIVSMLSLRNVLGLPARASDRHEMSVIIRSSDGPVGLLVDEIGDVMRVDQADHESVPGTLHRRQRPFLRCAYKLEQRLLLILDVDRVATATATATAID